MQTFEVDMAPTQRKFLLLLLRIFASFLVTSGLKEQKFAMEPQDQTAVVGSRVTLPCRVINKSGILQWTKDDFGLGTHRNLSGFDRYSMIGSDEEGKTYMLSSIRNAFQHVTFFFSKNNRLVCTLLNFLNCGSLHIK